MTTEPLPENVLDKDRVTIDREVLEWALARIGDEREGGCQFEPLHAGDPDHHGPEFAKALFDALKSELNELAAIANSGN